MAQADYEIIEEVRSLTGYSAEMISAADMQQLINTAKSDVRGVATNDIPDIYDDRTAERAVFWTTVMFTKIYMGELDAPNFDVGSIKVDALPSRDITRVWYKKLDKFLGKLESGRQMGITAPERDNRNYDDSFNREQF